MIVTFLNFYKKVINYTSEIVNSNVVVQINKCLLNAYYVPITV